VIDAGAQGVSVVSAIVSADDPAKAAFTIKKRVKQQCV